MASAELGTQIFVSDRTWDRMPGVRERCEEALRRELESKGCQNIVIEEPERALIEAQVAQPDWWTEEDGEWEPIPEQHGWEIMATGETDA